jgi:hypothetical protein
LGRARQPPHPELASERRLASHPLFELAARRPLGHVLEIPPIPFHQECRGEPATKNVTRAIMHKHITEV